VVKINKMKRTHNCGELRRSDLGKDVFLIGWVNVRRDHGGLLFIDLRDRYGITQVLFDAKLLSSSKSLHSEDLIGVGGKVQERPKGTINNKLVTGEIEVFAEKLFLLNKSKDLPFELSHDLKVAEEIRLTYRYLDLRRPIMQKRLIMRHRLVKLIRDYLGKKEFLEIETPILTKSTPEGARDYLVPSRLSPGDFYALPQSPQLFKQLLMVAGFEKYFQIARCFRDEDLRADRQPEHTQLDLECSFMTQEEILAIIEEMIATLFEEILSLKIPLPFPHLMYQEAISKYGTDKPDLRDEKKTNFSFVWVEQFPLFQFNKEQDRLDPQHHPFTLPMEEDLSLLDQEPLKVRGLCYDLILNGQEVGGGSLRIHKRELQEKIFGLIGLSQEVYLSKFGFLLEALEYGAPPHGGIALGLDRLLMLMSGADSIREVIAFPKSGDGSCPLTGAPARVSLQQLKELSLKIDKKNKL